MSRHHDGSYEFTITRTIVDAQMRLDLFLGALTHLGGDIGASLRADLDILITAAVKELYGFLGNNENDPWCYADVVHHWWCQNNIGAKFDNLGLDPLERWAIQAEMENALSILECEILCEERPWTKWCRK